MSLEKSIKKISLRSTIEVDDVYPYSFFSDIHSTVQPWPDDIKEHVHPSFRSWAKQRVDSYARFDTPPSAELQVLFQAAKEYVESFTGYDLSSIELTRTSRDTDQFLMRYSPLEGKIRSTVDVDLLPFRLAPPELKQRVITSALIHEFVHATGRNNLRLISVQDQAGITRVNPINGLTIVDARKSMLERLTESPGESDIRTGFFFEEALAEEIASRWRETIDPMVQQQGNDLCRLDDSSDLPDLPFRYLDSKNGYQRNMDSQFALFSNSAFPAAGIRALSEYTNVDLFSLMMESRDSTKEVETRRAMIRAIESVQKGLYQELRSTPQGRSSFAQGYEQIMHAIERDKLRRRGKVALAR